MRYVYSDHVTEVYLRFSTKYVKQMATLVHHIWLESIFYSKINGDDCGVFVCKFEDNQSSNAKHDIVVV